MSSRHHIELKVNGARVVVDVEPRRLLSDFLREDLGLYGTHVGCEHGVCGACTVLLNGEPVRACLMLAVQVTGAEIATVESLARNGQLDALQQAFWEHHALQCGFCTSGFLMTIHYLLLQPDQLRDDQAIREAIAGNLCRCTGYQNIVEAVRAAAAQLASGTSVST